MSEELKITTVGIKKTLKDVSPEQAIAEYRRFSATRGNRQGEVIMLPYVR